MAVHATSLAALTRDAGILFGADFNPEQWSRATWHEDVHLMRAAGVNLVTVGVFSWSRYEPQEGRIDLEWMGEVLDLLADASIGVDLATPTASPPPWLGHRYPSTLPVTRDGVRLGYGSRSHFSPASAIYREHCRRIARAVVERFADHPAVRMWHIGNELGQVCFGDEAAIAFRRWLRARYGTLDGLNEAWATAVWSQAYGDWQEVLPPRAAPYLHNPSQELDFRRFSSDLLLELFAEQKAIVRELDPVRPVTTNLMGFFADADYRSWAGELDIIADDAYPDPADPHGPVDAALTQDLMRSLAGGDPWMLMEQATSAVSWRMHNLVKSPARSRLESLQAVARGCDAVCFFQWRQARSGPERFHSAMLPLSGADTDVHRGVRRLGADLARLRPVVGARVPANVALVWDWPSWWAGTQEALPSDRLDPLATLRAWYRPLWRAGVTVDVVASTGDLSPYRAVLVPSLAVMGTEQAANLESYTRGGGRVVLGPFSGIADTHAHLHVGRFPVLLRAVVGVSGEEWVPLPDEGSSITWSDGRVSRVETFGERLRADGARTLATFGPGPLEGCVAVSEHDVGGGTAWYVGTVLPPEALATLLEQITPTGTATRVSAPKGIEVVVRGGALFLLNHSRGPLRVPVRHLLLAVPRVDEARGTVVDLLTDTRFGPMDEVVLEIDGAAVLMACDGNGHPTAELP